VEQPHLELRRLRVGVECAFVGEQAGAQAQHRSVPLEREFAGHVEVPREARGDQVLGAVLDPLHGATDQQ